MKEVDINLLPYGYFSIDKHGVILDVNKTYELMSGYSYDEIVGKNVIDFDDIKNKRLVKQNINNIKKGNLKTFEAIHIRKNGEPLHLSVHTVYSTFGYSIFMNDITETKKYQKKSLENEQVFKAIIDAIEDPIALINASTFEVVYANKSYGPNSTQGKTCYEISHGFNSPCKEAKITYAPETSLKTKNQQLRNIFI